MRYARIRSLAVWILPLLLSACQDVAPTAPNPASDTASPSSAQSEALMLTLLRGGDWGGSNGTGTALPPARQGQVASVQAARAAGFVSIDVPGALATRAFGINSAGQIVGTYVDAQRRTHGYLMTGDEVTHIRFPGAIQTAPWGVNSRGDVVGRYFKPGDSRIYGFLLRNGVYTDISVPGKLHTMPTKIGESGEVVGCYHGTNFLADMRGIVQRGDEITVFEALPSTMHNGITPGGNVIVGLSYESRTQVHGYRIDRGVVSRIDVPGAAITTTWDISPTGKIVGHYAEAVGAPMRGYSLDADGYTMIDYPGARWTQIFGINARGDMVGVYADANGAIHGFLLREPGR